MVTFLGGIRDQAGRRAFIPIAGRIVVAVDLADGAVLWSKDRIGRPIAATDRRLVTLDRDGTAFRLRLFGAADGSDVGVLDAGGMPPLAPEGRSDPGSDADTAEVIATPAGDAEIDLSWRVRGRYRGGAAPPPDVARKARLETSGRWRLNVDAPSLRRVDPAEGAVPGSDAETVEPAPEVSTDPNVVALAHVGERAFALKTIRQVSVTAIGLEARAADGRILWDVVLGESSAGPRALRK